MEKSQALLSQIGYMLDHPGTLGEIAAYMKRLEEKNQTLVKALHRATNMRPALLMTLGHVPEPVLEYCNDVRSTLRELGEAS